MRILHTANTYAPLLDGVAEVVRHISEELASRGHEVHVATRAVALQPSESIINQVRVHRFSVRGNLATRIEGQVRKYQEFVRAGQWDIMVNHCLQAWPTDAILDKLACYPWPSILVTHGLSGFTNRAFSKYYGAIPRYLGHYYKWVRISDVTEELPFSEEFNIPLPPIITNGVDLKEWDSPPVDLRQTWGLGQKPWIINVSNHNPFKGHRKFFELAGRLRKTGIEATLIGGTYPMGKWGLGRWGFSGGCSYECRVRSALSRSADLRMNLPRSQVVSAIKEADLLISTSNWEANSVLLLEAMAAGTPWVSFDVGSARENAGGVVVRTVSEMANVVNELLRNPDRREALGRAGRARAEEKHDWRHIASQYEDLYRTACSERNSVCAS